MIGFHTEGVSTFQQSDTVPSQLSQRTSICSAFFPEEHQSNALLTATDGAYPDEVIIAAAYLIKLKEVLLMAMESLQLGLLFQKPLIKFPMHFPERLLQSILDLIDPLLYALAKRCRLVAVDKGQSGEMILVDAGPILALLFEFLLSLCVGVAEQVVEDGAVACMVRMLPSGSG